MYALYNGKALPSQSAVTFHFTVSVLCVDSTNSMFSTAAGAVCEGGTPISRSTLSSAFEASTRPVPISPLKLSMFSLKMYPVVFPLSSLMPLKYSSMGFVASSSMSFSFVAVRMRPFW